MSVDYAKEPIGTLVEQQRGRARLFDNLGLDFYCQGSRTLEKACRDSGVDLDSLCKDLERIDQGHTEHENTNWSHRPLTELVDHIIEHHHDYLREEFPWLESLLDRLVAGYWGSRRELCRVRDVLAHIQYQMHAHMIREEQTVFSMIRQLERANSEGTPPPEFRSGSVATLTLALESEHRDAADALRQIHELTNGYVPPRESDDLYHALLIGLKDLETDLHLHLHKESNILFPRAIELEAYLCNRHKRPRATVQGAT